MPLLAVEVLGPEEINVGGVASYTVVVANLGEVGVDDVIVNVALPDEAEVVQVHPLTDVSGGECLQFPIGRLAPKSRKRLQIELAARARGAFHIQADVQFTATAHVATKICEPELEIAAVGPPAVVVGDAATFKVVVSNRGDGPAENVAVSQRLEGDPQAMTGGAQLGRLGPGESRELYLSTVAHEAGPLRMQFIATAWGDIQATAEAEIHVARPMLALEASGPRVCSVHSPEIYTIALANPGDAPASNVEAVAAVPPGVEVLAFDRPVQFDAARRIVRWRLPSLAPSGRESLRIKAAAMHADRFVLEVAAAADHGLRADTRHTTEAAAYHRRAA